MSLYSVFSVRRIAVSSTSFIARKTFTTSAVCGLQKVRADIFTPKVVQKVTKEDGISSDFSLIYRELFAYKSHKIVQIVGSCSIIGIYLLCKQLFSDYYFFTSYLGFVNFGLLFLLMSGYNLRMFYRVPKRMYYSESSDTYKIALNQMMIWQKPVIVEFKVDDFKQEGVEKDGWVTTGITRFRLLPLDRVLWMDRDSFRLKHHYWSLCRGRKEPTNQPSD